jgi:hypothetical protein
VGAPDAARIVAKPVSIYDINPDPRQPRRAIPSEIRQAWDGTASGVRAMFNHWVDLVGGDAFPLLDLLEAGGETQGREDDDYPDAIEGGERDAEDTLRRLITLAGSIHRVGLNLPITIVPRGPSALGGAVALAQGNIKYQIEQGERRWLAFHLLHIVYNDEKYVRIPSRIEGSLNLWRQAAENNIRSNLNAISKARQFALLLMDLYGEENFLPYDAFKLTPASPDRPYYAQVGDGRAYPIPPGRAELLVSTLSLKYAAQMREYRQLLRLPDAVWVLADDFNWTMGFITKLLDMADNDDHLVEMAWDVARKHHRRRNPAHQIVQEAAQEAAYRQHQTALVADGPDAGGEGYSGERRSIWDKSARPKVAVPRPQGQSSLWERTVRQIEGVVRGLQQIDLDEIDAEVKAECARMLRRALAKLEN